jgi:hypothetical protein
MSENETGRFKNVSFTEICTNGKFLFALDQYGQLWTRCVDLHNFHSFEGLGEWRKDVMPKRIKDV